MIMYACPDDWWTPSPRCDACGECAPTQHDEWDGADFQICETCMNENKTEEGE